VQGVEKAIRLRWGGAEKLISAEIDCSVDLDPRQKGVHMSRFPEVFEEAIDEVVLEEAFLVEELAEHIARRIVARQAAGRAEVRITRRYPLARRTPVTGSATQEMIALIGIAAASDAASADRRRRGDRHQRLPVRAGARARPGVRAAARGGFGDADVERILELVPLATHNQRGRGTLYVGSEHPVNAEQLARIVEGSMSSPIYELLKRPDELFVVEHAHLQPRFVEDSVRISLQPALERYAELDDATSCSRASSTSRRSTRTRSSPSGTARSGELRRELATASRPAPHRSYASGLLSACCGVTPWELTRVSCGSPSERSRAMLPRCRTTTRDRAHRGEGDHGHGSLKQHRDDGQRERASIERARRSGTAGRRDPHGAPIPPTRGATPRKAPPHVATTSRRAAT
jgi:GTP cyclohydrolase I/GTP cyclohydrolase-4